MGKIKVLQIIGSSNIGGAEKMFCSLIEHLDKNKFKIYVACPPNGKMLDNFSKYSEEIVTFNFKNWLNPLTIFSLKKYMKLKQIEIVHTHLYNADFMGIIAAQLGRVPYKFTTIHGHNFDTSCRFGLRNTKNLFCSLVYRFIYMFCDKVIVVCQALKKDLLERPGIKVEERKIKVIYNGFDLEKIAEFNQRSDRRVESMLGNNGRFVGVIGNFDRVKGHAVLLKSIPQVLKEIGKVKFIFVGDGEERNRIERIIKKLRIEKNIIFTGVYPEVLDIIGLCDLIVLPSLNEGLPLSILEAMALAKPIVATSIGGVPEVLENGKTGVLVPPRDSDALARAILYVLKDPNLGLEMGKRSRIRLENLFSFKNIVKEIENLYLGFIKEEIIAT